VAVDRRVFEACPDSVPQVRRAAVEWLREHGAPRDLADSAALAVTEAAANVVIHAYRNGAPARGADLLLELERDDGGFRVSVYDEGIGMSPRADSPGLSLGVPLMASVADRMEILTRDNGGAEVCMRWEDSALAAA